MSSRKTGAAPGAQRKTSSPEQWSARAGPVDVLALDIPPDASNERDFDIECRMVVKRRADEDGSDATAGEAAKRGHTSGEHTNDEPWHGMRVYLNGSLEWSRRVPTRNPGQTDSLDFHMRRAIPAGHGVRVVAMSETQGVARVSLSIDAEES